MKHTPEVKRLAIARMKVLSIEEVAKEMGIAIGTIWKWRGEDFAKRKVKYFARKHQKVS